MSRNLRTRKHGKTYKESDDEDEPENKLLKIYENSGSSESEVMESNDDDDSADDFEEVKKKPIKKPNLLTLITNSSPNKRLNVELLKLKHKKVDEIKALNLSDDSSSESDIETYLKKPDEINLNSSFFNDGGKEKTFSQIESSILSGMTVQTLSDSDSDVEAEPKASTSSAPVTSNWSSFNQLSEYTSKIEEAKKHLEKYNARKLKMKKKKKKAEKVEVDDIGKLLDMGEKNGPKEVEDSGGFHSSDFESCSEGEANWEEVAEGEEKPDLIPKEGVEITVRMPDTIRKKKGVDLLTAMKRRLNRIKKQNQVLVHRVHLLCWIAHGNYVNDVLNRDTCLAMALSLLPGQQSYPDGRADLKYLEQILGWYRRTVIVQEKAVPKTIALDKSLIMQINKRVVYNYKMLVYVFICILRALGLQCRLVLSLQVEPLKPVDLCSLSTKSEGEKSAKVIKDDEKKSAVRKSNSKTDKNDSKTRKKGTDDKKTDAKISSNNKTTANETKSNKKPSVAAIETKSNKKTNKTSISAKEAKNNEQKKESSDLKPRRSTRTSKSVDKRLESDTNVKNIPKSKRNTVSKSKDVEIEKCEVVEVKKSKSAARIKRRENVVDAEDDNRKKAIETSLDDYITNLEKMEKPKVVVTRPKEDGGAKKEGNESSFHPFSLDDSLSRDSWRSLKQNPNPDGSNSVPEDFTFKNCTAISPKVQTETLQSRKQSLRLKNRSNLSPIPSDEQAKSKKNNSTLAKTEKKSKNESKSIQNSTSPERESNLSPSPSDERTESPKSNSTSKTEKKSKNELKSIKNSTSPERELNLSPNPSNVTKITNNNSNLLKRKSPENKAGPSASKEKESKAKNKKAVYRMPIKIPSKNLDLPQVDGVFDSDEDSCFANIEIPQIDGSTDNDGSPSEPKKPKLANLKSSPQKNVNLSNLKPIKSLDVRDDIIKLVKAGIKDDKWKEQKFKVKKTTDSDSDSDFAVSPSVRQVKKNANVKVKRRVLPRSQLDRKIFSDDDEEAKGKKKSGTDVWVEVFLESEEKWISVDVVKGGIHCIKELYQRATHPVSYILSWDNTSRVKDISKRYCQNWNTVTRKLRVEQKWWDDSLRPFLGQKNARDKEEDDDLARQQLDQPLPKTISEYKDHPLYILKRHLLKFQAIYPPDAVILGFVRNEPVYSRDCVYVLHSREIWLKSAKVVKLGEKPYKIVKARPKWDKLSNQLISDKPLEIFGVWQVEDYDPPTAENGVVPRNAYGNVELFKECMLPKKTVHLKLPGLNKVAKKLNIDCASAVVGFDFHSGWSHPTFDGFVVCEEFQDVLVAAWYQDQEEMEKREQEKYEKRVYGNWRRLIKAVLIRERLKARYDFYGESSKQFTDLIPRPPEEPDEEKPKKKGPRFIVNKLKGRKS